MSTGSTSHATTKRILVRAPVGTVSISVMDRCSRMDIPIAFLGSDGRIISCHMPAAAPDGPLKLFQKVGEKAKGAAFQRACDIAPRA